MKQALYGFVVLLLLAGCKKDAATGTGDKVEIYLLKSFKVDTNLSTIPFAISISNAVLEDEPLVADNNIAYYAASSATFKLRTDIKPVIKDYGPDKAFAVTINRQPVYYGKMHPAYLSSIAFGIATIDPILFDNNELEIRFVTFDGSDAQKLLDKRNDKTLLDALKASGRLQ